MNILLVGILWCTWTISSLRGDRAVCELGINLFLMKSTHRAIQSQINQNLMQIGANDGSSPTLDLTLTASVNQFTVDLAIACQVPNMSRKGDVGAFVRLSMQRDASVMLISDATLNVSDGRGRLTARPVRSDKADTMVTYVPIQSKMELASLTLSFMDFAHDATLCLYLEIVSANGLIPTVASYTDAFQALHDTPVPEAPTDDESIAILEALAWSSMSHAHEIAWYDTHLAGDHETTFSYSPKEVALSNISFQVAAAKSNGPIYMLLTVHLSDPANAPLNTYDFTACLMFSEDHEELKRPIVRQYPTSEHCIHVSNDDLQVSGIDEGLTVDLVVKMGAETPLHDVRLLLCTRHNSSVKLRIEPLSLKLVYDDAPAGTASGSSAFPAWAIAVIVIASVVVLAVLLSLFFVYWLPLLRSSGGSTYERRVQDVNFVNYDAPSHQAGGNEHLWDMPTELYGTQVQDNVYPVKPAYR